MGLAISSCALQSCEVRVPRPFVEEEKGEAILQYHSTHMLADGGSRRDDGLPGSKHPSLLSRVLSPSLHTGMLIDP